MLLYKIDVEFPQRKVKFGLVLKGDDHFASEGDWSVYAPGEFYIGRDKGYWEAFRRDSNVLIGLYESTDTGVIVSMVREVTHLRPIPELLAVLSSGFRFPLTVGQEGLGTQRGIGNHLTFRWKVAFRFF